MIKKITLILFCFIIITSCGKKSDPVYKETKIKIETAKIS